MQRRIDLQDKHHNVTLFHYPGKQLIQVNENSPEPASLTFTDDKTAEVRMGSQTARVQMAVKGEQVFIRAFGRTFNLNIIDPVEQAAQESGGRSSRAAAPMPGIVVDINVKPGDRVLRNDPLMTIESMKILTVIKSPRDGEIAEVLFRENDAFEKNAALVTLKPVTLKTGEE